MRIRQQDLLPLNYNSTTPYSSNTMINSTSIIPLLHGAIRYYPHANWFIGVIGDANGGYNIANDSGGLVNSTTQNDDIFTKASTNIQSKWLVDYGVTLGRVLNNKNNIAISVLGASQRYDVNRSVLSGYNDDYFDVYPTIPTTFSKTRQGFGFGFSLEHQVTSNIMMKIGYRYLSFQSQKHTAIGAGGDPNSGITIGLGTTILDIKPHANMIDLALIADL